MLSLASRITTIIVTAVVTAAIAVAIGWVFLSVANAGAAPESDLSLMARAEDVTHSMTDIDTLPSLTIAKWDHPGGQLFEVLAVDVDLHTNLDPDLPRTDWHVVQGEVIIETGGQRIGHRRWDAPFRAVVEDGRLLYRGHIATAAALRDADPGPMVVHLTVDGYGAVERMTIGTLALSIQ